MKLTSKDFIENKKMDKKSSYSSGNISPHLKWKDAPSDTKSFAISCNDPDAPIGDWIHWGVYDIPLDIDEISQRGPITDKELENDYGVVGYGGPAPPSGTHRYFFNVYALNVDKLNDVKKINFMERVKQKTITSAEIIRLYSA